MRNSTGASLMAAIVIMVLIATLGGTFTFLMSTHYRALPLDTDFAQANSIAHAGVEWTLKNLIPTANPIPFAGGTFSVTQNGIVFTITARHGSARVIFTVSPPAVLSLILIPSNGPTGTLLTIQGQGFQSNETLNLASSKYGTEPPVLLINLIDTGTFAGDSISGTNNELVTTDTIGNFEVTWVVTWITDPGGVSVPYEIDSTNGASDPPSVVFTVTQDPSYVILISPISGYPGTILTITGFNLSASTTYNLEDGFGTRLTTFTDVDNGTYDGDAVGGPSNRDITTDISGGFQITWRANQEPTADFGDTIDIRGGGFTAGFLFTALRPLRTLTPSSVEEDDTMLVRGDGFYRNNAAETGFRMDYDGGLDRLENMLDTYPIGIVSIGSDSYDLWKTIREYYCGKFKERILSRNGKVVIRPDSGDPCNIVCGDPDGKTREEKMGVIRLLEEGFGSS
ncbi:hypothetical protein IIB34_07670, partial [PVC group bacterium]|nr:hypothetical protein [PVC group bacterium]